MEDDDGAIRRPGPWTTDPAEAENAGAADEEAVPAEAEAEAEQSDGYVESDDDGGSSIDEEPDSPNADSAADLQRLLEAHEAPFGQGVAPCVETVLAGGARGRQASQSLKKAAQACREAFARPKMGQKAEDDLSATAEALLDALLDLWQAEHDDALRDSIARCGEAWWAREQAPFAAPRVLPYLLVRALSDGATSEDVARCATSATMLAPVDLDDASAAGLRGLLASTASSPAFLRSAKGKDFVAGVLRGNTLASSAAHQSVKKALPSWTQARARAAGDCYKRAFDALAKEGDTEAFEEDYLQDLARAFLFSKSKKLAAQLKSLLDSALHCSVTGTKVKRACVERVYAPLLWRHITAPNNECRRRAFDVLGTCFPIADPDAFESASDPYARRLRLPMAWVVSFSISGRFRPRRGRCRGDSV